LTLATRQPHPYFYLLSRHGVGSMVELARRCLTALSAPSPHAASPARGFFVLASFQRPGYRPGKCPTMKSSAHP
jgi:hypothetical protein